MPPPEETREEAIRRLQQRAGALEARTTQTPRDHGSNAASYGYRLLGVLLGGVFVGLGFGFAVDWESVGRLDDEMLVNAIAQVAPLDVGAKQALLEEPGLDGRADLLVQLMQFHRLAIGGGAEIESTLQ